MQTIKWILIYTWLACAPAIALFGDTICIEPTRYVRVEDSPFDLSYLGSTMFLDDLEDGSLDGPLISPDTRVRAPGPLTDSVDADDGVVDGQGNGGHSLETTRYIVHPTFPWTYRTFFDIIFSDIDRRPNAFGFVWTDGFVGSTLRLTAFSPSGATIAECTYGSLMDGLNTGETMEDRFIGIVADQRIAGISGFSESVGFQPESERIELDHVQFGQQVVPEPSLFTITMIMSYLWVTRQRHRNREHAHKARHIRFAIESLEPRQMFVVVADNPAMHLTDDFTGVAKLVNLSGGETPATCTGTLLATGRHVLTAGHCLNTAGTNQFSVQFEDPVPLTRSNIANHVHPLWQHHLRNDNPGGTVFTTAYDFAILELNADVPASYRRYEIYTGSNEVQAASFWLVGYGATGTGSTGATTTDGLKRSGQNRYDATIDAINPILALEEGDPERGPPATQLIFDFDDGTQRRDGTSHYLGVQNLGTGVANEVALGGGDSGGPSFVGCVLLPGSEASNCKLAGVHSYITTPNRTDPTPISPDSRFGEVHADGRVSAVQCWINNIIAGNTDLPPRIEAITLSNSISSYTFNKRTTQFSIPFDPPFSAERHSLQLRSVPVAQPNQIAITFSENVSVLKDHLQVISANTPITDYGSGSTFSYSAATRTAVWTFDPPMAVGTAKQIAIKLSSDVRDYNTSGQPFQRLDGEWSNPANYTDPNLSKLASGNGCADVAGQIFQFHVTLVPADFNRDNIVDGSDFTIWNQNKFTFPTSDHFIKGDANGDAAVDGSDFGIWNSLMFTSWTHWPGSQQSMAAGGPIQPSATWYLAYQRLLDRFRIFVDGHINHGLSHQRWEQFADAVMALFDEL